MAMLSSGDESQCATPCRKQMMKDSQGRDQSKRARSLLDGDGVLKLRDPEEHEGEEEEEEDGRDTDRGLQSDREEKALQTKVGEGRMGQHTDSRYVAKSERSGRHTVNTIHAMKKRPRAD